MKGRYGPPCTQRALQGTTTTHDHESVQARIVIALAQQVFVVFLVLRLHRGAWPDVFVLVKRVALKIYLISLVVPGQHALADALAQRNVTPGGVDGRLIVVERVSAVRRMVQRVEWTMTLWVDINI